MCVCMCEYIYIYIYTLYIYIYIYIHTYIHTCVYYTYLYLYLYIYISISISISLSLYIYNIIYAQSCEGLMAGNTVRGDQSLSTLLHVGHKHCLHFSICACHPCAGAMLIFSVSFQF